MFSKSLLFITFIVLSRTVAGQGLTPLETRWLAAGAPVIAYARQVGLPLDIIVQPQPMPGAVPLALGFRDGRCKLVLSMRGNGQAEDILRPVAEGQRPLMIEAMMAHEIGHCWRYAQGAWHVPPSGFVEPQAPAGADIALAGMAAALRDTQREEAYSDLVALAWMRQHHTDAYPAVYAWMSRVRSGQSPAGTHVGSHDTLAWLRLVADGAVFDGPAAPFEQVRTLWVEGLRGGRLTP